MEIKVAIIEDQREIRDGLSFLINSTAGFRCTGTFRSMEAALETIGQEIPDVALVDIGLPGMSGIDGVRLLKERYPDLASIILSVYDDDDRIFKALCSGACGYLLKKTPPSRLLESLKEAAEGGSPMSPEVARRVITLFQEIRTPASADYQLTPHETRLLKMLIEGHSYKTAAASLGVTVHTVSFHLRQIYRKLQVHSKSEAVARVLRDGVIR